MEFHGNPCPNTPWNSMENIPSNSMEFHEGILHGVVLGLRWGEGMSCVIVRGKSG